MERQTHWNNVHSTRSERQVSWFEALPALSLRMMEAAGLTTATCVLDVGGGRSRLVDALLERGLSCLTVIDVSGAALDQARERLGARAAIPVWMEVDVAGEWSLPPVDIWHDRAVFHFLTDRADRVHYTGHLLETLKPGGSAIIATFALDGPELCSGLPVQRYSPSSLATELGNDLTLVDVADCRHLTPWGSTQSFQYCRFIRIT